MLDTEWLILFISVHQKMVNIFTVKTHQFILVIDLTELPEQGWHDHIRQIHAFWHKQWELCSRARIRGNPGGLLCLICDKVRTEKDLTDADDVPFFQIESASRIGGAHAPLSDDMQAGLILFTLDQLRACRKFFYSHWITPL